MKINKTLAIMAGGKSSRMNYNNKALLSYKEKTFIENIIEAGKNFKKLLLWQIIRRSIVILMLM